MTGGVCPIARLMSVVSYIFKITLDSLINDRLNGDHAKIHLAGRMCFWHRNPSGLFFQTMRVADGSNVDTFHSICMHPSIHSDLSHLTANTFSHKYHEETWQLHFSSILLFALLLEFGNHTCVFISSTVYCKCIAFWLRYIKWFLFLCHTKLVSNGLQHKIRMCYLTAHPQSFACVVIWWTCNITSWMGFYIINCLQPLANPLFQTSSLWLNLSTE